MIIGIDPGVTGAMAVLRTPQHSAGMVSLFDMPATAKTSGTGNQVSCDGLVAWLSGLEWVPQCAFIERVNAMPPRRGKDGVQRSAGATSMFGFGRSAGVVEMLFAARGIPRHFVTPNEWKKHFGLIGKDKDAARALAMELFPAAAGSLQRKKDVGRADALLIAEYGRQKLLGDLLS